MCYEQGLIGNELFAIDGCKMSSNASKEWSGTLKELTEKRDKIQRQIRHHIKEHKRIDSSESSKLDRAQRLKQTIETLNDASEKIDRFLKIAAPRMGKGRSLKEVKSNITDNESAKMTTSKGTIQGYNGVAAVDKKHQVIIEAQAFGEGQEHHALQPIAGLIKKRYERLQISKNIYGTGTVLTADTGFANEANMQYLHDQDINAYVPDNQFRTRDPKFADQKAKYGKRYQHERKHPQGFPPSQFHLDPRSKTCVCPAGESMWLHSEREDNCGNLKLYFEGRLSKCRACSLKTQCMRNPESADTRKGHGRQVSFILERRASGKAGKANYTEWMKIRVDSTKGKQIYSHRMSVVEPVFGNIGANKGLNRFSLRSRKKVQGQGQLYCMIHNIEKLMNYGRMAV